MIQKFRILEDNKEIAVANSMEEATMTIECWKVNNPHKQYEIQEIQVSAVKPGFGRDPDLH